MTRKPKFTIKQRNELRRLYLEGARDVDLVQWFGITNASVRRHTLDIRRKNPKRMFDHEKALRLHETGMTFADIGRRFGVAGQSVSAAVKRAKAERDASLARKEWKAAA